MTKLFLTLAAGLALAAPAFADPASQKITFKRDGVNYVANVYYLDGVQHIDGHEVETGRSFALKVLKGQVSGVYDANDVSYAVPASSSAMQTASR